MTKLEKQQRAVCKRVGADYWPVDGDLTAGVARNIESNQVPVNGLRHPPESGTNGWYIWAGEEFDDSPEFFSALHVRHIPEIRPEVAPYLALPPGWRFLVAPDYEDVWFDESLLHI